ncbi:hypothetical protein [Variovorax sp. OK605]|uniref:hypothetical protein n=1 Tax=Variovorax sp. OK605 TaxID=1855317 RepID=UPI001160B27E|nr:hypothetical protein [Variovorax sp. OK605]
MPSPKLFYVELQRAWPNAQPHARWLERTLTLREQLEAASQRAAAADQVAARLRKQLDDGGDQRDRLEEEHAVALAARKRRRMKPKNGTSRASAACMQRSTVRARKPSAPR